jgi:hypothetical protein
MDFFAEKIGKKIVWNRRIGIYQQSLPMVEPKTLVELWFSQIALVESAQTDLKTKYRWRPRSARL